MDGASDDRDGFAGRVRLAMAWRWGSQFAAQLLTWGSTILVVRLLEPADYGLFAMSQAVIALLTFMNGWSFASSLIRAREVDDKAIGQAFTLMALLALVLGAAAWLIAPYAAAYYSEPRVVPILRVSCLLFLTTPFIALPACLLARKLDFRGEGIASVISAIAGAATALFLAWRGHGVWALVYAPIVSFTLRALILNLYARVPLRPVVDFSGTRRMLAFGGALTLAQLFWIIQSQADIFIAGHSFSAHQLGLYSEALFLTLIVTGRFLPPINEVAYPAYSELHQQGASLAPFFERTVRTVTLVVVPIYLGMALVAEDAVAIVFGAKWAAMAPIMAGLALAMPAMAIQILCPSALTAMGREKRYLAINAIGAALFTTCFLIGVANGPDGLVAAWWIAAPALLAISLALTLPLVGTSPLALLRAVMPALVGGLAMAGAVIGLHQLLVPSAPSALRLVASAALGAATYLIVLRALFPAVITDTLAMLRRR